MRVPAAYVTMCATFFAMAIPSCGGELTAPTDEAVFVQVVLGARTAGAPPLQPGYVLKAGVAGSGRYLAADRFAMSRVADDAPLAWRSRELTGSVQFESREGLGLETGVPNYVLPKEAPGTDSLGHQDLVPGSEYRLVVVAEEGRIEGTVVIPDSFSLQAVLWDGAQHAVWPSVAGAAGYEVFIPQDEVGDPALTRLQTDTVVRVGALPSGTEVVVHALDPALFRYMTDQTVGRAGISEGFGVLGAFSSASLAF